MIFRKKVVQNAHHAGHHHPNLNLPASHLPKFTEPDDFRSSMHWRIFRIMAEFTQGFEFIANHRKSVTVFGSARIKPGEKWYEEARIFGKLLSEAGFAVVTGGGPGIMQAANQGAHEAGGISVGLNIQLPTEQRINPYVNRGHGFHYFFSRKVMMSYSAQVYTFFPGGFGTLDEAMEIITLIQTKKIATHIPVIFVGKEFWQPFLAWVKDDVLGRFNAIDPDDLKIITLVDSAEEAMAIVRSSKSRNEFDR